MPYSSFSAQNTPSATIDTAHISPAHPVAFRIAMYMYTHMFLHQDGAPFFFHLGTRMLENVYVWEIVIFFLNELEN